MEGWIKLHRQIAENEFWLYGKFSEGQAWTDLLILASHKKRTVPIRGIQLHIKPGQLCWSQKSLAERWKWGRRKVGRFLKHLQKREMIHIKVSRVTTIITILNWGYYQGSAQQTAQQTHNKQHTN